MNTSKYIKKTSIIIAFLFTIISSACTKEEIEIIPENNDPVIVTDPITTLSYAIVDTDVTTYYSNTSVISAPSIGNAFYGQDASNQGNQASYTNNQDGTITDNVTGLMWEQDMGSKISFEEAFSKAEDSKLAGHTDWRVPTIKEVYSLILFTGRVQGSEAMEMFINTSYFNQPLGDVSSGEREIDAQTWSSTQYVGGTMNADETVFGVNFVDGRIKGYPKYKPGTGTSNSMYFRMVRENEWNSHGCSWSGLPEKRSKKWKYK